MLDSDNCSFFSFLNLYISIKNSINEVQKKVNIVVNLNPILILKPDYAIGEIVSILGSEIPKNSKLHWALTIKIKLK